MKLYGLLLENASNTRLTEIDEKQEGKSISSTENVGGALLDNM